MSVFEILFAWRTGMTLCATTNDTLFRDIQHVIRSMGVTHLSLTPTVAALVNPQEVPGVQFLVTAGEALTEKVHQTWAGKGLYQGNLSCYYPLTKATDTVSGQDMAHVRRRTYARSFQTSKHGIPLGTLAHL